MEAEVPKLVNSTSYTSGYHILAALLFSSLILSSGLLQGGVVYGQPERSQQRWWSTDWRFRVPLLVVNSLNVSVTVQPVFFYLELPTAHAFSAVKELRLIDRSGVEVPSYILYEYRQGHFALGVYVLAFLSFTPNDARVIHIYYGNPDATRPWYRSSQPIDVLNTKFTQISLQNPVYYGPDIELRYGGSYPLTVSAKMSYGTTVRADYGPSAISTQKFTASQGWMSPGNMTIYGFTGAGAKLQAGGITLVRSVVTRGGDVWISDFMVNEGSNPVGRAKYYFLMNASRLVSLGIHQGDFNPASGLASITVGGTNIAVKGYSSAYTFQVSNTASLVGSIRRDSLDMSKSAFGPIAFAFSHGVEVLKPGDHVEQIRAVSIGSNMTQLSKRLEVAAN